MTDIFAHQIQPYDEDDHWIDAALPLLVANLAQRIRERRTRREDERDAISAVEARKRLVEAW